MKWMLQGDLGEGGCGGAGAGAGAGGAGAGGGGGDDDVCDDVSDRHAGCRGRARIVADDISANIKHKMTKDQKKVMI